MTFAVLPPSLLSASEVVSLRPPSLPVVSELQSFCSLSQLPAFEVVSFLPLFLSSDSAGLLPFPPSPSSVSVIPSLHPPFPLIASASLLPSGTSPLLSETSSLPPFQVPSLSKQFPSHRSSYSSLLLPFLFALIPSPKPQSHPHHSTHLSDSFP